MKAFPLIFNLSKHARLVHLQSGLQDLITSANVKVFPYICIGYFHLFKLTSLHSHSTSQNPKFTLSPHTLIPTSFLFKINDCSRVLKTQLQGVPMHVRTTRKIQCCHMLMAKMMTNGKNTLVMCTKRT